MKNEFKIAGLAFVLAVSPGISSLASEKPADLPSNVLEETLLARQRQLESLRSAQKAVDAQVKRLISLAMKEKLDYFSSFYDSKVEALQAKDKSQDSVLVQSIIDFLAEHPKDEKTPFALLKLAQIYIEEADTAYRSSLDRYYRSSDDERKASAEPKRDYSYAIRPLEKIRTSFRNFQHMDACLYLLGYTYLNSSRTNEAWATYEDLARSYPKSAYAPEAFFRTGEFYFSKKDFSKAQDAYEETIKLKDDTFYDKAVYKMAWSQYLSGQYTQAIKEFILLLDYSPANGGDDPILKDLKKDAGTYIAFSLFKKGNIASSISFIDSMKDRPYSYSIYKNLGDIYLDRGLYSNALSVYISDLAAHPSHADNPSIHKSILSLIEKDYSRERAVSQRKTIIDSYMPGSAWRVANPDDQAMNKEADALLEDSLYWLGVNFDREARDKKDTALLESATSNYIKLISLFPRGEKAYNAQFYLGEAYLWLGDARNALVQYDSTLKNNFFSRYYTEALYSEIVLWEKVLDENGGLEKFDPSTFKTAQELETSVPAKILSICNEFIEKAAKDPRIPGIMYRSSEVLEKFGSKDKAIARYSSIIDSFRESPFAKDALRKILNMYVASSEWDLASSRGEGFLKDPFSDDPKLKSEVRQIVALADYKIAKTYESSGKNAEAAEKLASVASGFQDTPVFQASLNDAFVNFQRSTDYPKAKDGLISLAKDYPQNSLAPSITLEIADRERDALKFESALAYYSSIMEKWPKSQEAKDSILRKALVYEILDRPDQASESYIAYSKKAEASDLAKESVLKSLIILHDSKSLDKLSKAKAYAEGVLSKDNPKLALLYLLTADLYLGKNNQRFEDQFKEGEYCFKKVPNPDGYLSGLYFRLKLETIKPDIDRFLAIKLAFPRKSFLSTFERKALALSGLEKRLAEPIGRSSSEVTAEAIYYLGLVYEDFGQGIMKVALPSTWSDDEKKLTADELNRIGDPMVKKARAAYLKNISLAKEKRVFNGWIRSSLERLSALLGSETTLGNLALNFRLSTPQDFYFHPGFQLSSSSSPDKTSKTFKEAIALLTKQDASSEELKRGLTLFDDAYDLDPGMKEARFNKAVLLRRLDRLDVAEFIYTSLKSDPKLGDLAQINLAEIYATRKEYDRALKIYEDRLAKDPKDLEIASNVAEILRLKGETDRSLALSMGVLESSPFNVRAYNNIAEIYSSKGMDKTAEAIYKKALEKNPKNSLIMDKLAVLYLKGHDFENGYQMLLKAKAENPYDRTANLNSVYVLLKTQNYEEGLDIAKRLWASQVAYDPDLYINLGLAYISMNLKREAVEHYNANLRFAGPFRQEAKGMITELKKDENK